ncbi:mucin [Neisseria meningitidis]|nr:mucin [Neisseria meningitidis]MBG8592760.1 mucin [Neisseria meningitidis]MBG8601651.1 mucin [Neisseria meningitidis]MBG8608313.1 mucin [Neisseria meningitidis]MBG8612722.1 mucin [Neisseria meningitidis]
MDRKNKRRLKPSECEACPPGTAFFTPKNLKTTTKPHAACPRPAAAPK